MTENDSSWIVKWKNIARYLNCSIRTAKNYYYQYNLPIKSGPGKFVRILKSELDQFIVSHQKD